MACLGSPDSGRDKSKANYGDVAAHPGAHRHQLQRRRGISAPIPDWTHFNAVDYNADLDQIVVSLRNFSEIWIIDHSTTTKEAAGREPAGESGKGGDLLYRWGNPRVYRAGTAAGSDDCSASTTRTGFRKGCQGPATC